MDEEPTFQSRAPVAEETAGEVAFEIAAAPDGGPLHERIFQGAIDPGTAGPFRRADVPVGMVVEGDQREWLGKLAGPDGAQVMEIAGAEEGEETQRIGVFRAKGFDLRGGGDEAERLRFLAD